MAAVIFRAHEDSPHTRQAFEKLRTELSHLKMFVLSYLAESTPRLGVLADAVSVSGQELFTLPYPERLATFNARNLSSACELPVMKFFRDNPGEDYYWIVEFDVHYTGHWRDLFDTLGKSRADLLGTTILRQPDIPEWVHWPSLRWKGQPLPPRQCIKSFVPFARLSNAALTAIDQLYTEGLTGHFEATWPTACAMRGLQIEDIGGAGPFTPRRWRGKHYTNTPRSGHLCPGTFVYRPTYSLLDVTPAHLPPLLWHPVKS